MIRLKIDMMVVMKNMKVFVRGYIMKRIVYLVLLMVLFIPFVVNAETCEAEKVNIKSIDLVKTSSEKVSELKPATAEEREINVDLSLANVGDEATYKIVVENKSVEDYDFDKTSLKIDSDYVTYSFASDDDSTIIKANSTKTLTLTVKYKKEVPDNILVNGEYNDSNIMDINLSNDIIVNNPKTGMSLLIGLLVIVFVFSLIAFIISGKKRYATTMVLAIASILVIPMTVNAICKCQLKLNSNVKIVKVFTYKVDYVNCRLQDTQYFPYEYGMTWREYFESDYYRNVNYEDKLTPEIINDDRHFFLENYLCDNAYNLDCKNYDIDLDDVIVPSFIGYYQIGDYIC